VDRKKTTSDRTRVTGSNFGTEKRAQSRNEGGGSWGHLNKRGNWGLPGGDGVKK